MHVRTILTTALCTLTAAAAEPTAKEQIYLYTNGLDRFDTELASSADEVNSAVAASLIYFYPVLQYARTFGPLLGSIGSNTFQHQNYTTSADNHFVTRANIDTVYSLAAIDLSTFDVVFTIPRVPANRTHVFPFHDFYGNNFATLGSFSNASEGRWLLRLGKPGQPGIELNTESSSEYTGFINFPTTYGALFPRLLLLNQPSDTNEIRDIQSQFELQTVPRGVHGGGKECPPLTSDLINVPGISAAAYNAPSALNLANATRLFEVVGRVVDCNFPVSHQLDNSEVAGNLTLSGVRSNGSYTVPANLNLAAANAIVQRRLADALEDPNNYASVSELWPWPLSVGDWYYNYPWRAQIQYVGYLGLTADQVLYPTFTGGVSLPGGQSKSALSVQSNESIIVEFASRPPLKGFWSITVYDRDGFIVPNRLDRYGLGDRNNLTYVNGEQVYGGANHTNGPFQLLLQSAHTEPPKNWTSNWLPTPTDGDYFFISLRLYGPTPELVNGSWSFPTVSRQAAIEA